MARARERGQWSYRGYWIDNNVHGSPFFYGYWYDSAQARRAGRSRRKSLETDDIEEAKDALVAFALKRETDRPDALVLSVLARYHDEVACRLPSREQSRRTLALFREVLEGPERVSELSEGFQIDRILKPWLARHGHSAKYLSRNMSMLSAAIRHCRIPDPPKIFYDPEAIAKRLRIAPPGHGRWFPRADDDLARFLDRLGSEMAFRATMIMLNTGCRPEAALDLGPDQADFDSRLIDLNPPGRPPTPTKRRAVLRLTENLAGWFRVWDARLMDHRSDAEYRHIKATMPWKLRPRFVPFRNVDSLQSAYIRTRALEAVNLPRMMPYSIRNKVVTVLRMYGVGGAQCSQWLGHADPAESRTTWRSYGEYDPRFLADAANAIDDYLWKLNSITDRDLFATLPCKFIANPVSDAAVAATPEPASAMAIKEKMVGAARIELATPTMST